MPLDRWIRLSRPVDLRVPTNRAIALASITVLLLLSVAGLARGLDLGAAAVWGATGAVAVFLTWALGREVDPDRDGSAFIAAAVSLAAVFVVPLPELAMGFWLLLVLRVANRTPGRSASWFDSITVLGLTAYGAFSGYPEIGLLTAGAFLVDGVARDPVSAHRFVAVAALAIGVGGELQRAGGSGERIADEWLWIALAVASALFLVASGTSAPPRSVGDADGRQLDRARVLAGQLFAFATAWAFALMHGEYGVIGMLPAWCAILGSGIAALVLPSRR